MLQRKMTIDSILLNYDESQFIEPGGEVFRLLTVQLAGAVPELVFTVDTGVHREHESIIEVMYRTAGEDLPDVRYHYLGSTSHEPVGTLHWFGKHRPK